MPQPFLQNIANAYVRRYEHLDSFLFIFPNKRAGTFFLKHLSEASNGKIALAPAVCTISEFVHTIADRLPSTRIDLLFRLYKAYSDMLAKRADGSEAVSFDTFRSWGDVVLSDFNDVDMFDADPDELFTNVADFKEIQTDFLTDEQREIMEEYFGVATPQEDIERFWKHFHYKSDNEENRRETDVKERFMHLWEVLSPLYHSMYDSLERDGLAYPGLASRIALERIADNGIDALPAKKLVFVGFNVLSLTEYKIFKLLKRMSTVITGKKEPLADFVWDMTGPAMLAPENVSMRMVRNNIERFPKPDWLDLSPSNTSQMPPVLRVISSPGNITQTAIAGEEVEQLRSRLDKSEFDQARVAVILPNEALLIPMLYKLPDGLDGINLTMGYPLKLTSTASFVSLITRMQMRKRKTKEGTYGFFHEDVSLLLAHPFTQAILGSSAVAKIKTKLAQNRVFVVTPAMLGQLLEGVEVPSYFRVLSIETTPKDALDYLEEALTAAALNMDRGPKGIIKSRLDASHIEVYLDAIHRLRDAVEEYGIGMSYTTVFALTSRLLAGETVNFEGEPLRGLQIAGVLETRCLDFDYLIIPSMNENIFPRKGRKKSFIPDSLRHAFGLPTPRYDEGVFAYYFYRMISRAKEVTMIYDSRCSGLNSGDVSRYVLQLQHLYAKDVLRSEARRYSLTSATTQSVVINKTPRVMEKLEMFRRDDNKRHLSASVLQNYCQCPVKFYYSSVEKISDDVQPEEYMGAAVSGTIVHDTMMDVYLPASHHRRILTQPILFTRDKITAILDDEEALMAKLRRNVNLKYLRLPSEKCNTPLSGDALLTAEMLLMQVKSILRHDMEIAPFLLYGCEVGGTFMFHYDPEMPPVQMRYAIDRIDALVREGKPEQLRIVDYKTGKTHLTASSMADVCNGTPGAKHIIQLMLYTNFYFMDKKETPHDGSEQTPVIPVIYGFDKMEVEESYPSIPLGKEETDTSNGKEKEKKSVIKDHTLINKEFLEKFREMMNEIFNPEVPFTPCADGTACRYCPYTALCEH